MFSRDELITQAQGLLEIIDDLLKIVRNEIKEIDNGNSDKCNFDEINDLFQKTLELTHGFFKNVDEFYQDDSRKITFFHH